MDNGVTSFLWIINQRLDNIVILVNFDTNWCLPLDNIGREGSILRKSTVVPLMDNPVTRFESEIMDFELSTKDLKQRLSKVKKICCMNCYTSVSDMMIPQIR